MRQQLQIQLNELKQQLDHNEKFGLSESLGRQTAELSSYDNHPADLGSELYEREKDLALMDHAERAIMEVEQALVKLDTDSYGRCAVCGQAIPWERLMAVPTTLYCKTHASQKSVSDYRPVEEEELDPPFGRTSLDEQSSYNGFDGEDAWQIVEQWGTSNTPAMAEYPRPDSYDDMEIESEENDGYVEDLESFLATDIYGRHVTVVRNKAYKHYMEQGEGDPLLEPDDEATAGEF
ncbi:TraR/DksA C4-type zinc finger protein [Paenibacillus senegalensis]|uniref:TraR/DksA C4-type zinc finger protein n=1 Tax=Paenibacillus senegalensis TaxID=1465766 RepID=UPI000287F07C|nr:TraR/DksA C4-type zinc finger protein [Paenibacillus senegalensis]